ncbi:hypothetical protein [Xanthomonas hortorum]|uniref:hypothetical protein n=3 Tax=Xanthomonas TaxID=338 RepID=UPI0012DB76F6|nr:hypothetical protein [Xanthomonas hortorum]
MTGGEIKFVNFTDYSHNLTPARASYADAVETLITQGHVMDLTTKNVSKLETGDQRLVREYLNANTVSLSAPMGGVSTAWSESDKQRAQETMRRILAREKAANSF